MADSEQVQLLVEQMRHHISVMEKANGMMNDHRKSVNAIQLAFLAMAMTLAKSQALNLGDLASTLAGFSSTDIDVGDRGSKFLASLSVSLVQMEKDLEGGQTN